MATLYYLPDANREFFLQNEDEGVFTWCKLRIFFFETKKKVCTIKMTWRWWNETQNDNTIVNSWSNAEEDFSFETKRRRRCIDETRNDNAIVNSWGWKKTRLYAIVFLWQILKQKMKNKLAAHVDTTFTRT